MAPIPPPQPAPTRSIAFSRYAAWLLLAVSAAFFALHFVHLTADFPNNSPWSDWSKYTDEGWYSDAAVRHALFGHWYFAGDFNPGVALPVWPALEWGWFKLAGVSLASARSLTLLVFAATLLTFYVLIARHTRPRTGLSGQPLAAPLCLLLLCASPFLFVFERMAILEPLLICVTALAMLTASYLHPLRLRASSLSSLLPTLALTLLIPAAILTKTTAIFLLPAVFYMVWARAGYRLLPALRLALPPLLGGAAIWCAYFFLLVRPHYLADYQYLFSANAYTGIALEPLSTVVLNTLSDGLWMGHVLYPCFFVLVALTLFWRPRLLTNPLVPALWLWTGGYFFFLAYHNNLQPRYYLVLAVPVTAFVALAIDEFRRPRHPDAAAPALRAIASLLAAAAVLAITVPDAMRQISFLRHPTYDFEAAAHSIAQIVRDDPSHPRLILSISGSDITLMTGVASIDDDFGTDDLDKRVAKYRPGWYVAWNDVEDDKAESITPLYSMERVAAFPAMDDADRNLLILYRLDPREPTEPQRLRVGKAHGQGIDGLDVQPLRLIQKLPPATTRMSESCACKGEGRALPGGGHGLLVAGLVGRRAQPVEHALPHLRGGRAGEGDGQNLLWLVNPGQQRQEARGEQLRLAGARRRLHNPGLRSVQRAVAGSLVRGCGGGGHSELNFLVGFALLFKDRHLLHAAQRLQPAVLAGCAGALGVEHGLPAEEVLGERSQRRGPLLSLGRRQSGSFSGSSPGLHQIRMRGPRDQLGLAGTQLREGNAGDFGQPAIGEVERQLRLVRPGAVPPCRGHLPSLVVDQQPGPVRQPVDAVDAEVQQQAGDGNIAQPLLEPGDGKGRALGLLLQPLAEQRLQAQLLDFEVGGRPGIVTLGRQPGKDAAEDRIDVVGDAVLDRAVAEGGAQLIERMQSRRVTGLRAP